MLSQSLEYLILVGSIALTIAVVLVAIKSITDGIYHSRTVNRRAKRRQFILFVDCTDARRTDIEMTKKSVQRCRYPYVELVMQTRRTDIQKTVKRLKGDYALFLQAGTRLHPDSLFRLNRLFSFRCRVDGVVLNEQDVTTPTLLNFYTIFSRSLRNIGLGAVEFAGFRYSRRLVHVAMRVDALRVDVVGRKVVTLDRAMQSRGIKARDWIALLYSVAAFLVVHGYVLYGQKAQLITVVTQVALTSLVLSLADSRSSNAARKMLALFAPTSLFLIPASFFLSLMTTTIKLVAQRINRRTAVRVRRA